MRSHLPCFSILAAAFVITAARPALADEPIDADEPAAPPAARAPSSDSPYASERPPTTRTESYWYGWQTLIADGASLATMMLGAATPSLAYVGVSGYVLGGPSIHVANRNYGAALGSLVMRPLLPLAGGYIGRESAGTCTEKADSGFLGNCFLHGLGETILGVAIGATIAITVDAAVLARGERVVEKPKYDGKLHVTDVAPTYDARTGTAGFGLGGTF